jgi:hypothetical protein
MMNKDMADYYQLNTQAHDSIPTGDDSANQGGHGDHGAHS